MKTKLMTEASQRLRNHLGERISEYTEKLRKEKSEKGRLMYQTIIDENQFTLDLMNIYEEKYELLQSFKDER